jgi:tRNA threonylcarbamoyladenosine biosynthesis protein TsaB
MKQPEPTGPFILAIETATMIGSVALFSGEKLLGLTEIRRAQTHAKLLTPMIQTLLRDLELKPADLDAIAVAKGPGSYTGLRVGVSTAKGLCMALDKPLLSMGSLEGLAAQVSGLADQLDAWICPMIDARRMEVYCAMYDGGMVKKTDVQARIIEPDAFQEVLNERNVIFVGDGVSKCVEIFRTHPNAILLPDLLSSASGMGKTIFQQYQAGTFEDLVTFEPFYLKDFRATIPKNPLL